MRLLNSLLLAVFAYLASADVEFTTPAAGASLSGLTISMAWQNSGSGTAISALTTYQIFLMAGDNTNFETLTTLISNGVYANGNTAEAVVATGLGGPTANAYFLKIVSVAAAGGQIINYSDRFSVPAFTGALPATVVTAVAALDGATAGPASQDNAAAAQPAAGAGGVFAIPYSLQTGLTRYAPMQGVPPTKITATNTSPLYPTSAFTIATTYMPSPTIVTTMTESQTFSVQSNTNTAAPASSPTGGIAARALLERWKD